MEGLELKIFQGLCSDMVAFFELASFSFIGAWYEVLAVRNKFQSNNVVCVPSRGEQACKCHALKVKSSSALSLGN